MNTSLRRFPTPRFILFLSNIRYTFVKKANAINLLAIDRANSKKSQILTNPFTRKLPKLSMNRINDLAKNGFPESTEQRDMNHKRTSFLEWDEYFMATAFLAAKRSKDPCTQVGVCIVNKEKKIVGVGYNGMPIGCSDDIFPWDKTSDDRLETKYLYVCHAEMNAILNKNSADVKECAMYVGLFPCNECAKIIIQSGIKSVIYMSDKHAHKIATIAAKKMFDAAGVEYRQYIPQNKKIVIDFSEINWNEMTQLPPTPVKNNTD